jgi:hypothetical protein
MKRSITPGNYSSGVKYSFSYRLSVKKQDGTFKNYSETDYAEIL